MKTRLVLMLLLFNVAVLAAGYVYFSQYWGRQEAQERQAVQTELAAWQTRAAKAVRRGPPVIVYRTNAFNWSQIESTDYRQYIANLRAIGCPESTLKDIIMTDVMRLYAQRRGKYYLNGRDFKYWETNDKRKLKQAQLEEREKQLAEIDKELPAVLRELLGVNYEREVNKYFVDTEEDDRRLAFLPDDKRSQLLALRDQFEGERERVLYSVHGAPDSEQQEELRKIEDQQDAALGQLLTADEKEEYELSESPTADRLRQQLIGFNPTESEFRDLFRRQYAIDEAYEYEDTNDAAVQTAKETEEQQMIEDFKSSLAPDRAAQFDLSQNAEYQNLTLLSARYDLPDGTSQTVLDMEQAAQAEKQQLIANKDIPAEQVEVGLQAIQAETERSLRQTLGDAAYSQYSQNANWISGLAGTTAGN